MANRGKVPRLTLGDRLMLSREKAHIGSTEMAAHFKKSRHTITNWEKDRSEPSHTEIKEWARLTGYSLEWLLDGQLEASVETGMSREQLAKVLVAQLLGSGQPGDLPDPRNDLSWQDLVPDHELDKMQVVIDLRELAVA